MSNEALEDQKVAALQQIAQALQNMLIEMRQIKQYQQQIAAKR